MTDTAEAKKPHDQIWLQWFGPDYPEHAERYFNDDVTWCEDKINEEDIRYIRADVAEKRIAELEAELARLREDCPHWEGT